MNENSLFLMNYTWMKSFLELSSHRDSLSIDFEANKFEYLTQPRPRP